MSKILTGLLVMMSFVFFYVILIYIGLESIFSQEINQVLQYIMATGYLVGAFTSMLIQLNSLTKKSD